MPLRYRWGVDLLPKVLVDIEPCVVKPLAFLHGSHTPMRCGPDVGDITKLDVVPRMD